MGISQSCIHIQFIFCLLNLSIIYGFVVQVEKLNNAMKQGVLRMIQEEEGEAAANQGVNFGTKSGSASSPNSEGSSISDYLSFALSCATGYDEPAHDSSGIRWNPTTPPATSRQSPKK